MPLMRQPSGVMTRVGPAKTLRAPQGGRPAWIHSLRAAAFDAAIALGFLLLALAQALLFPTVPVWPPAGIALAAGLLRGDRAALGVFVGSLLSSWMVPFASGSTPFVTSGGVGGIIALALGHALASVGSGRALRRQIGERNPLHSPVDTLWFFLCGVGAYALICSLVAGVAQQMWSIGPTPLLWLSGSVVGVLVVAPVIVAWSETERRLLRRSNVVEATVTVVLALGATACIFSPVYSSLSPELPFAALFALPLLWGALRLDQRISLTLAAACFAIAWYGTAAGYGALVDVAGPLGALSRAARFAGILAAILLIASAIYTERTRAEESLRRSDTRLRLALATGHVGVWDWDLVSDSMTWSDGHFSLLGLPSTSVPPSYATWAGRIHPDDLPLVEATMQDAREQGASFQVDFRVVWPDGTIHWLEARGQFLGASGEGGEPVRMIAAMVDLTERKRAEAAMQEESRQKDEFLAMLAHELRNPLAPIRNAVYVLRHGGDVEPRMQRYCDMIDRQVGHMVRLVDDLLDVSRVTSGKIRLQKERVDLSAIVHHAVETVQPMIDRKRQVITFDPWPQAIEVEADAARLLQVIANLLTNAAKFTPEGGRITLRTERAGESAIIRVRDTGVGIAPELLPRIFDLFVQGTVSPDRTEGGLGIGLPLVRRLVEMHGGHVEAHSAGLGQGSELVVTWPASPAASAAVALVQGSPPSRTGERLRILVVEDNVDAAESLVVLLDLKGHEVRTAYSGFEALDVASVFVPDVAFIDLGLPGIDGFEVARRLRQLSVCRGTFLIALSGYGRDEDKERAREAGFDDHLTKPVDPSTIEILLAESRAAVRHERCGAPSHPPCDS